MIVRDRAEADLAACADLAAAVHESDGYPRYLPRDLHSFIRSPSAYQAWVAERDGRVVGQVVLHPRAAGPVMELASEALGRPRDGLGVVSRLLVAPDARGERIGQALLEAATQAAFARDLWPVLDVDVDLTAAIALYERCGWVRAGQVSLLFSDGTGLCEWVYVGPPPAR